MNYQQKIATLAVLSVLAVALLVIYSLAFANTAAITQPVDRSSIVTTYKDVSFPIQGNDKPKQSSVVRLQGN